MQQKDLLLKHDDIEHDGWFFSCGTGGGSAWFGLKTRDVVHNHFACIPEMIDAFLLASHSGPPRMEVPDRIVEAALVHPIGTRGLKTSVLAFVAQGAVLNLLSSTWKRLATRKYIKDMPPNMVASGIFVRHKWWKLLRIQDIRYSRGCCALKFS